MTIPLLILAFLAFFGGFLNIPELMGGSGVLKEFLSPVFADAVKLNQVPYLLVPEKREWYNIALVIILVVLAILAAYRKFVIKLRTGSIETEAGSFIERLAANKFYIDELYDAIFVKPALKISGALHEFVEVRFIDRVVNGAGTMIVRFSNIIRYLQAGHVGMYMFFMIIGILLILFFNILF